MTQMKTDGIGFQVFELDDFPKVYSDKTDKNSLIINEVTTENSTNSNFNPNDTGDPLLQFIARKNKKNVNFDHRYSKKAMAFLSYLKQVESPNSPAQLNSILMSIRF